MMNDPFVVEQARSWAKRLIAGEPIPVEQRIGAMYLAAFARPPSDRELAAATAFMEQQQREMGLSAEQGWTDERVWADLAHVLMNVKEFVFVK